MGFSSFKCSVSNISIPAYPAAGLPIKASAVVLVLPDNSIIKGVYNGYGDINGCDIYSSLAQSIYGEDNEDLVFGSKAICEDNRVIAISNHNNLSNTIWTIDDNIKRLLSNKTNEEILSEYQVLKSFDHVVKHVKIVREDHYFGQRYEELKTSKNCDSQGYFYKKGEEEKIRKSLNL